MVAVLLIAGIGFLLAGLLAIGFGIPVKEFSFGNTLILTGVIGACTGAILLGIWMMLRALKDIARRLGAGVPISSQAPGLPPGPASAALANPASESGSLFTRDQQAAENPADGGIAGPTVPPRWQDQAASRDRGRLDAPAAPESVAAAPAAKPRRNLLFSSSSRKERERAEARTAEPAVADRPAAAPPVPESAEAPPATFDDAWPKSDRSRAGETPQPPRRGGRAPSTFTEPDAGADRQSPAPTAGSDEQPPVTILKSGVVDGMAYSLYSDGSIEAQMPEGMMRFASIDELRSHLDHRT
jgi:hypothetical protein